MFRPSACYSLMDQFSCALTGSRHHSKQASLWTSGTYTTVAYSAFRSIGKYYIQSAQERVWLPDFSAMNSSSIRLTKDLI